MRSLIGRDAMGHGDLKLLAALGAWLGWQALPWVLLLACFLGLVFAMWRQKSFRPRGEHPFGPFLAGCAAGVFLAPTAVHSWFRSEEHTSELQSLMRISYAVFCL